MTNYQKKEELFDKLLDKNKWKRLGYEGFPRNSVKKRVIDKYGQLSDDEFKQMLASCVKDLK